MSLSAPTIKRAVSVAVVGCIGYFFWRTFRSNWAMISGLKLQPNYLFVALAFSSMIVGALLATWAWHVSVNALTESGNRITARQSIATVNAGSLTRYVPGKIWSYAFQMYQLANLGFSKSLVLYVNLVNMAISFACNVMVGLVCWLVASDKFRLLAGLGLAGLVLADLVCVQFSAPVLHAAVKTVNRVFKRNLGDFSVSPKLMLQLHAIHFLATAVSGLSVFLLSLGVGYHVGPHVGFLVTASFLLADVIGYLAIMVPGGLGVREGLMYAMLGGAASGPVALVLPLATRVVSMLSDISIGAIALKLLPSAAKPRPE